MDAALFFAPGSAAFKMPELGLPQLTSYLVGKGFRIRQRDLNVLVYHGPPELAPKRPEKPLLPAKSWRIADVVRAAERPNALHDEIYRRYVKPEVRRAPLAGFSVLNHEQLPSALYLARRIKKDFPRKKVCIGGSWCMASIDLIERAPELFKYVDFLVGHRGEKSVEGLLLHLRKRKPLRGIPNLFYLEDGRVRRTQTDTELDINALPPPDFDGFDLPLYPTQALPYQTSSGCEWGKCRFCHHHFEEIPLRAKDPVRVVDQLEELKRRYRVTTFDFADLSLPLKMMDRISRELIRRRSALFWIAMARGSGTFTPEFARRLKRSGCDTLRFGLETGSPAGLREIHKGVRLDAFTRNIGACHDAGIGTRMFLLLHPGQSKAEIAETGRYLARNAGKIDWIDISYFELARFSRAMSHMGAFGVAWDKKAETDTRSFGLPHKPARGKRLPDYRRLEARLQSRFEKARRRRLLLLINPPVIDVRATGRREECYGRIEPVALLKIGEHYRRKGYDVRLIDCIGQELRDDKVEGRPFTRLRCGNYSREKLSKPVYWRGASPAEFRKLVRGLKPDEILFTSVLTYDYRPLHRLVRECRKLWPRIPVTVGGVYATLVPRHAERSGAGRVFAGRFHEVERLPANWSLLDRENLPRSGVIKFSRGCLHRCSFCAIPVIEGRRLEERDVDDVLAEIENKHRDFSVEKFDIWESNIVRAAERRVVRLLDGITARGWKFRFEFADGIQPNLITPSIAKKLKRAGFVNLKVSLESSSPAVLKAMRKPVSWETFKRAITSLRAAGYDTFEDVLAFVILGAPYQRLGDIVSTIADAWKTGCRISDNAYTPIPGSEDFERYASRLKGKDLMELHPELYPMARPDLPVSRLQELRKVGELSSFFQLDLTGPERLRDQGIVAGLKRAFRKDLRTLDEKSCPRLGAVEDFVLFDLREDESRLRGPAGRKIAAMLARRIDRGRLFYMTRPLPAPLKAALDPKWIKRLTPPGPEHYLDSPRGGKTCG